MIVDGKKGTQMGMSSRAQEARTILIGLRGRF